MGQKWATSYSSSERSSSFCDEQTTRHERHVIMYPICYGTSLTESESKRTSSSAVPQTDLQTCQSSVTVLIKNVIATITLITALNATRVSQADERAQSTGYHLDQLMR